MAYDIKLLTKKIFEEFWSKGNLGIIDEFFDPGFEGYDPVDGKQDKEAFKRSCLMYRGAFPDLTMQVTDLIAEGDKCVARWTAVGTHKGPFMGVKATGKRPTVTGVTVCEYRGERCIRSYSEWNS